MSRLDPGSRPYVLAVGGFDPCGGAGIVADAKTINALGAYGLTVMTANTLQHEDVYCATHWVDASIVYSQFDLLLLRYRIAAMKVGMLPDAAMLRRLLGKLRSKWPEAQVVVDPVLRSTASRQLLRRGDDADWTGAYAGITLLTPNLDEYRALCDGLDPVVAARHLGCGLLLKGGHAEGKSDQVVDRLYYEGSEYCMTVPRQSHDKHGTGCVLSSAIATGLAYGQGVAEACAFAQRYVANYLASDPTRLGMHRPVA